MTVSNRQLRWAAAAILQEQLVAFPTETVYGLGANALSDHAVASVYAAKGRPQFNPLIVHVRSLEEAHYYGVFSETAWALAHQFWPGPLTLVLPRREQCRLSLLASAGLDTVALRVPAHPLAQALLHEAGVPVAAPSANRSGHISPTQAAHVIEELGKSVAIVLDGGPCAVGIESTVLDASSELLTILRPGSITKPMLEATTHQPVVYAAANSSIHSPGMLESHYAPDLPVRLNAVDTEQNEALLAFGVPLVSHAGLMLNLSPSGNLQEAAANLFRMLRELDSNGRKRGLKRIAVMPIPSSEDNSALGYAIQDRLTRAAAPRG